MTSSSRVRPGAWLPLAAMFYAVLLLAPSGSWAQEGEGEEEATPTGERMEGTDLYRDCSAEALAEFDTDDLSGDSPADRTLLPSGLSPEEADAVRAQIYEVQQRQIDQLNEMLRDMPADYGRRSDVLFRLAEAYWAVADADNMAARALYNACVDDWMRCIRDDACAEPVPDYSAALDQYREILRDDPDYERYDEVLFRLGDGLIQADQAADGVQYLTRLTNNYPTSRFIPEARFLMGDHFFDNGLLIAARQNYEDVLNYQDSDYYNFAIYKIGWIDLNENEFRNAVQNFQTVVTNIDSLEQLRGTVRFDLRDRSVNDMLVAWTEIDNGWIEARQYLRERGGEDLMRRKLLAMGELYHEKGKDEERIALLGWFVENYPNDAAIPDWMEGVAQSLTNIGNWDRYEEQVREYIAYLDPNGSWGIQNASNTNAMGNARIFSEATLLGIIQHNFEEAGRLSRPELYQEVALDYEQFLQRFPDSDEAYNARFFYAEVLYHNLNDHPRAGEQYLEVVRMNPEGEHAHDSIIGALEAYDDLMMTEVPGIDDEREIISSAELAQLRESGITEQELGPWSQGYVEVVEYFAELYPDDERIPAASWRAAEIYRRANRIEEAAYRFETIIQHHPTHQFAEEAAISAFICFQFVENWERIEHWARFLLEQNMESPDFNAERLRGAIAYAINEQAIDLAEAGQNFEAAEMYIGLYNEFPASEFSPAALYNAAAIYERARRLDTAISTYNTFLEAYPDNPSVPEAKWTLGLIYDSQADFAEAANWFEAVDTHEGYERRADAAYNAARLREALSEFDRAVQLYDHYMLLTAGGEDHPAVLFRIANIELNRGNHDATAARYEQIRALETAPAEVRLAATVMQARVRDEQARTEDAMTLYQAAYDQYGPGVLLFDEATRLPTQWQQAAGWSFEAEEARVAALPYAAEARFRLADVDFETCQAISLEFPEGRWRVLNENLQSRGEALDRAQRAMFEVIYMGDAAWSVAATTRIGELYQKFYDDMYALPTFDLDECIDSGYAIEDCEAADEQYSTMMYEMMYPIETKARESLGEALVIAYDNGVYTDFTREAVQIMARLDRSIRVLGEEGVEPENVGIVYSGAGYRLDFDAVLARFQEIEQQMRANQPGPNGVPADGTTPAPESGDSGNGSHVAEEDAPNQSASDNSPAAPEQDGEQP